MGLLLLNPLGTPPAISAFRCYIDGLERDVFYSSLTVKRVLNGRASAVITLQIARASGWRPYGGEEIAIYRGVSEKVFGGSINTIVELMLGSADASGAWDPTDSVVQFQCQCVDYSSVMDRRLIAGKTFDAGSSLNNIVFQIWLDYLKPEGLPWRVGLVDFTAIASAVSFDTYQTIAQAFNQLATITGCQWWFDVDRYLHFSQYSPSTAPSAPFNLTEWTDAYPANYRKLNVNRSRANYRNRQWVRTSLQIINTLTETFTGDGGTTLFNTVYKIQNVIAVTVDGAPVSVSTTWGAAAYYYVVGADGLYSSAAPILAPGRVLSVTYNPPTSNVISAQNDTEIAARQAAEGGTGLYEAIDEATSIATAAEAQAYAVGMLARFGAAGIPTAINFETDEQGVAPGQKMNVNIPGHAINGDYIVQSTSEQYIGLGLWRNGVSLISAASPPQMTQTWNQYLGRVVEIARKGPDITQQVQSSAPSGNPASSACASWVLAEGADAVVAADVANPVPIDIPPGYVAIPDNVSLKAKAGDEPIGADFIVDILYHAPGGDGSGVSIFYDAIYLKMILHDGSAEVAEQVAFALPFPRMQRGGWLTVDILQVGSTTPGKNLGLTLRMTVTVDLP